MPNDDKSNEQTSPAPAPSQVPSLPRGSEWAAHSPRTITPPASSLVQAIDHLGELVAIVCLTVLSVRHVLSGELALMGILATLGVQTGLRTVARRSTGGVGAIGLALLACGPALMTLSRGVLRVLVVLSMAMLLMGCPPERVNDNCSPGTTRCSPAGVPQTCSPRDGAGATHWTGLPLALPCANSGGICCLTHGTGHDLHACVATQDQCIPVLPVVEVPLTDGGER